MLRREFLALVAKTAAATSLVDVAKLWPAPAGATVSELPRAIDWTAWNRIGIISPPSGPAIWSVNGRTVTGEPAIVQKLARLITVERDQVRIAGAWTFPIERDDAASTFIRFNFRERREPTGTGRLVASGSTRARMSTLPPEADIDELLVADTERHLAHLAGERHPLPRPT